MIWLRAKTANALQLYEIFYSCYTSSFFLRLYFLTLLSLPVARHCRLINKWNLSSVSRVSQVDRFDYSVCIYTMYVHSFHSYFLCLSHYALHHVSFICFVQSAIFFFHYYVRHLVFNSINIVITAFKRRVLSNN